MKGGKETYGRTDMEGRKEGKAMDREEGRPCTGSKEVRKAIDRKEGHGQEKKEGYNRKEEVIGEKGYGHRQAGRQERKKGRPATKGRKDEKRQERQEEKRKKGWTEERKESGGSHLVAENFIHERLFFFFLGGRSQTIL
jgi:hypothetical protein